MVDSLMRVAMTATTDSYAASRGASWRNFIWLR